MPTHAESRQSPYSCEQLFDLVADVDRYPEFLPWCIGARVTERTGSILHGDLIIGYRMFRERFTSRVILDRPHRIKVEYLKGPLRHLSNEWEFTPQESGGCRIDFHIEFEIQTPVLKQIMSLFFNEALRRMVAAFEKRAEQLYGRPEGKPVPANDGTAAPSSVAGLRG